MVADRRQFEVALNIGLNRNLFLGPPYLTQQGTADKAVELLEQGYRDVFWHIMEPKPLQEPTLVATFQTDVPSTLYGKPLTFTLESDLARIATLLRQDCIAAWFLNQGSLHGPAASRWSPLRKEMFVLPPWWDSKELQ